MQTIDKFNFAGKKAFVRVDFNVPLDENFNITAAKWQPNTSSKNLVKK